MYSVIHIIPEYEACKESILVKYMARSSVAESYSSGMSFDPFLSFVRVSIPSFTHFEDQFTH